MKWWCHYCWAETSLEENMISDFLSFWTEADQSVTFGVRCMTHQLIDSAILSVETQIRGTKHSGPRWRDCETYPWLQPEQRSLRGLASHQPREPANRSSGGRRYAGRSPHAFPKSSTRGWPGARGSPASCHPQPHPCHSTLLTRDPQRATQKEVCQRSLAGQETHPVTTHLIRFLKLLTLRLPAETSGTVTWHPWIIVFFFICCVTHPQKRTPYSFTSACHKPFSTLQSLEILNWPEKQLNTVNHTQNEHRLGHERAVASKCSICYCHWQAASKWCDTELFF